MNVRSLFPPTNKLPLSSTVPKEKKEVSIVIKFIEVDCFSNLYMLVGGNIPKKIPFSG